MPIGQRAVSPSVLSVFWQWIPLNSLNRTRDPAVFGSSTTRSLRDSNRPRRAPRTWILMSARLGCLKIPFATLETLKPDGTRAEAIW